MATSNEWLHIYQNNLAGPPQQPTALRWPGDVTDATTVTTTSSTSSVSNQLARVTRPTNARRRSRASRRTPTTLLNTDTTNFRAMVQQFTGGNFCDGGVTTSAFVAAPAAVAQRQPLISYNTNYSSGLNYYGTGGEMVSPPVDGYNMEFRQPQHQHYYTIVADNDSGGGDHQHGFV
ncbi:hypothetical protein L1987_56515 [Smallanthus sonchifolius]|uniref:Uncharacterized protein n=1 Tax=Smallanthus sonchifolius TaxID=185202 RepID=A0ACB9EDM8_9ASTR|nr:hypothetical protein L1987_56515 [Smallanthus sonchifolius]